MKTPIVFAVVTALALSFAACKKKDDAGGGAAKTEQAGPKEQTAEQLFKEYSALSGAQALSAYRDGVVVSGTVLRTGEEGDGSMFVHLDAAGGKWITLVFADKGAAAKAKGLKKGDAVKAKCSIAGSMGTSVDTTDCELR